ncbi:MAG TPA: hypothetical protein VN653_10195 [Anaerolineales bacterium]|nr:hypothetical protein [Anaerolineales bacterium]
MVIEILSFIVPALVLLGLCQSTEIAATIRRSEGLPYKRTNSLFE